MTIKKVGLICLVLCAMASPAMAQTLASGSITTNGQSVTAGLRTDPNLRSISVQVTGTWTGTLTFQCSVDGSTYVTFLGANATTGSTASSTTASGVFVFTNSGFASVRVTATAAMTGTAVITINQGQGSGGAGSSGGGDASAANQTTTIGHVDGLETLITETNTLLGQAGSPIMVISDVTNNGDNEDEHAVCTADCTIFSITAFNHTAASAFLRCENDVIGSTTPGSETASANEPDLEIPASTTGAGFHVSFGIGISYSTALTCWIVSDEAASGTTDVAANDVRVLWNRVQ
jgi:hypothetical protein